MVYASPLYHYTINAAMKAFIERTLPVLQPFFEQHKGTTHHPLRQNPPKAVFLSVAGFPERRVFDQLSSWVQFVFGRRGNLVAEIYRPAAESLPYQGEKAQKIFEAIQQAGREIVRHLTVSPETMSQINQDIVGDKEGFPTMGNLFWKTCIAEGVTPREFAEKGLMPRPDSIETFLMFMSMGFNPEAAQDLRPSCNSIFPAKSKVPAILKLKTVDSSQVRERRKNHDVIMIRLLSCGWTF